jgi:hypothetical protein
MNRKTIFGTLLVSVVLCSQGFGFELLNGLLGLNNGGCGECKACAKVAPCEKVACCEKACPAPCEKVAVCEKACPKACEKVAACEPACGKEGCESTCKKHFPTPVRDALANATPVRDMFAGLKDMFESKGTYTEAGCGAEKGCCPEPCEKVCPKACEKVACCEKACPKTCEKVAACEPACEKSCEPKSHKLYRRPVLELLEGIFGDCCKKDSCGECGDCAACDGVPATKSAAPATAPAKAPEQAAPLPAAPKADPSASNQSRGIYEASRSLVRN